MKNNKSEVKKVLDELYKEGLKRDREIKKTPKERLYFCTKIILSLFLIISLIWIIYYSNYSNLFFNIFISILIIFFSTSSLCLAIRGFNSYFRNVVLRFFFWHGWLLMLPVIVLPSIIDFGRGAKSPLPWIAFKNELIAFGMIDGIVAGIVVLTTDLWLLWIPAKIMLEEYNNWSRDKKVMLVIINLISGLLLMTKNNPIINLLKLLDFISN